MPLGLVEGVTAGRCRGEHAARGQVLAPADCLIGAAFKVGGRLATGNPKDFPMPVLHVEHWPSGE